MADPSDNPKASVFYVYGNETQKTTFLTISTFNSDITQQVGLQLYTGVYVYCRC